MKRLTLVRHAKASWGSSDVCDYERPLNEQGRREAPLMGRAVKAKIGPPDVILCSPAVRARATADVLADTMGSEFGRLREDDRLYDARTSDVLDVICELESSCRHALLVGHCPSMLDVANLLSGERMHRLPPCGTVLLKVDVTEWSSVAPDTCVLEEFFYPGTLGAQG
jgi:phosphohistidine phosphatase